MSTRGKFPFRYLTILLSLHPTTLSQANSLQQPDILPHSLSIDSSIPLAIRDKSKCVRLSASTVSARHPPYPSSTRASPHRVVGRRPLRHHTDILTMYLRSRPGWLSNSQLLLGGRSPIYHHTCLVHAERLRISKGHPPSASTRRRWMFTLQRVDDAFELALANHGRPSSFTASSTASRYVANILHVIAELLLTRMARSPMDT